MKKYILFLFVCFMLANYAASAQMSPTTYVSVTNESDVEIIYPLESRPLDAEKLGELKLKKGFYLACDIDNLLSLARTKAAEIGGNAIYVTSIKPPVRGRNCYMMEGDVYKLNEPYTSSQNPFFDRGIAGNGTAPEEVLPEFPGGVSEMIPYIYRKINFPNTALRDKVGGRLVVSFKVDETGKILDVMIEEGIRWDLDQELLRVVSNMPEWVPGYQNGKAVPVVYTLPIKLYPRLTSAN